MTPSFDNAVRNVQALLRERQQSPSPFATSRAKAMAAVDADDMSLSDQATASRDDEENGSAPAFGS